ncbi:16S rRNA (cytidine(1402)-2'-O)-methyltransferase [Pseudomonadota bacterium]
MILKEKLKSGLYIVATPIGNLGDMTFRAIETLKQVDLIMCEDTRVTGKLLQKFEIKNSMRVYNDNSDKETREYILKLIMKENKSIALVSDAGTPLISDPGYKLVKDCIKQGVFITSLPGASALTTALSLCGLPTNRFMFCGFLSSKVVERKNELKNLINVNATFVFYESPNRLVNLLDNINEVMENPRCCVLRELTKLHEEIKTESAQLLLNYYKSNPPKGEIVVIVDNNKTEKIEISDNFIKKELKIALKTMSLKDAVKFVSENNGLHRKKVYKIGLLISG